MPLTGREMPLEHGGVQPVRGDGQPVPAVISDHDLPRCAALPVRFEGLPQPEHVGLDRGRRPRRNVLTPQRVRELLHGQPAAVRQQQPGQHRALLPATQRHRGIAAGHPQRPQHSERDAAFGVSCLGIDHDASPRRARRYLA